MDDERWIQLKTFRCPVFECPGQNNPRNWMCAYCNTPIYIAQTGYMRCNSHNSVNDYTHYGKIMLWEWNCGNHGDHSNKKFREADFQGFTFALSHAIQQAGARWVGALCVELEEQMTDGRHIRDGRHSNNLRCQSDHLPDINEISSESKQVGQPSHNEHKQDDQLNTCTICCDRQKNVVLIPCGHTFCLECVSYMDAHKKPCPICRATIENINQVFN